jgi:MFS family permease
VVTAFAGPQGAFWIDSATYVVSVATLLVMRSHAVTQGGPRSSVFRDAREGFAYVASRPWLWGPILTASVAQFLYAGPQQSLVPYLVKFELHSSATALGIVLACAGLGTVAAGALTGRLGTPRRIVTFMVLGWALGIGSIAFVGLAQAVWQAAAGVFVLNLLLWSGEILWLTLLGLTVPNHLRGRVSSIDFLGSSLLVPLSMALTGPLATLVGARTVLVVAGIAGGSAILLTLLIPRVRQPQYLEGSAPAPAR